MEPQATPRAPRRAIALEYDGAAAPRISALGHDELAEQIIALALEHGVPMVENHDLAALLAQLELGDEIPETLYLCIAQIIAFAYRLQGRVPEGWQPPASDPAPAPAAGTGVIEAGSVEAQPREP